MMAAPAYAFPNWAPDVNHGADGNGDLTVDIMLSVADRRGDDVKPDLTGSPRLRPSSPRVVEWS
jgi:hypothetical protein